MKFRKILAIAFLMTITGSLQAQQRKCELNVELISPSEGSVIQAYAQYNLIVKITNNGPNTLKAGDTVFYNVPMIPAFSYKVYVLQDSVPVNNSANFNLVQFANINSNELDQTTNFYVNLVSNPDGNGAFLDTFLTNNIDMNSVTLKACGNNSGTAIHNVNGQMLNFSLFPNPATNSLRLETENLNVKNILVADLSGRKIISKAVNFNKQMELDITALPAGMYFLKLDTDKGIAASKFIKQ